MSKSRTRPTRPRTVSLTGAELNADPPMCNTGRANEMTAAVNSRVTTTAHDHSHQSRRSTWRTRLRRSVLTANAVVPGCLDVVVSTRTRKILIYQSRPKCRLGRWRRLLSQAKADILI